MVTIRMICLACVTAFLLRTTTLVLADEVPRVAIIGGGMGGTYAAYLLGQSPVPLQIDLCVDLACCWKTSLGRPDLKPFDLAMKGGKLWGEGWLRWR